MDVAVLKPVEFGVLITSGSEVGVRGSFCRPNEIMSWVQGGKSFTFNPSDISQREKGSLIKVKTDLGLGYYEVLGNNVDATGAIIPMVKRLMPKEAQEAMAQLKLNPQDVELVVGEEVVKKSY